MNRNELLGLVAHLTTGGMAHSVLQNYVVPGLSSMLIGGQPGPNGCVRLFMNNRTQHEHIVPHSHRFNFQCLVLRGEVVNTIFEKASVAHAGDRYQASVLEYDGKPGQYRKIPSAIESWMHTSKTYQAGEVYGMTHDQVHSITFSREAVVLFFEGPQKSESSIVLEPFCHDEVVPMLETKPWMFKKAEVPA